MHAQEQSERDAVNRLRQQPNLGPPPETPPVPPPSQPPALGISTDDCDDCDTAAAAGSDAQPRPSLLFSFLRFDTVVGSTDGSS
jgi:hypothetical protein